jgi:hypothetical protein
MNNPNVTVRELYLLGTIVVLIILYLVFKKKKPEGSINYGLAITEKSKNAFSDTYGIILAKKQPEPYKSNPVKLAGKYGYDLNRCIKICNNIIATKSYFDDDEDLIYNIYGALPNIFICSHIAFTFKFLTKVTILDYLQGFLSEKEIEKLYAIVNKKPIL